MITGAFIIDLLLLALTLFVGQVLADRLNTGNKTIAFQQALFLNAFALIEFFKAVLRVIFCPRVPELRPFNINDDSAKYWAVRLSVLSGLIGYGLLVAVPIISNQVNVQFGALANVLIMLCITVWSLYLIFHNKMDDHRESAASGRPFPLFLQPVYPRLRAGVALAGKRVFYCAVLLLAVRPGKQPEIYDGGDV